MRSHPRLRTAISVIALGAAPIAEAQTILSEGFGDVLTSGCDSQWVGDCEQSWSGMGDNGTLEVCTESGSGSTNYGVSVLGGSGMVPSGIQRSLSISSNWPEHLSFTADLWATTSTTATTGLRVVFKDAGGTVVGQTFEVFPPSAMGIYSARLLTRIPSTAKQVKFQVAVLGPGSVWLDHLEAAVSTAPTVEQDSEGEGPPYSDVDCQNAVNEVCEDGLCGVDAVTDCEVAGGTMEVVCIGEATDDSQNCDFTVWCNCVDYTNSLTLDACY